MSTDFFTQLETQLIAAHGRRARRRPSFSVPLRLVAGLAGAAAVAALILVLGGRDREEHRTPARHPIPTTPLTAVSLHDVTVAVLNATTTPGLARGAATKLQARGAKIGIVTNAPDQGQPTTVVYYATPRDIPAARRVAQIIGTSRVQPSTASTQEIAGSEADVMVVVGADDPNFDPPVNHDAGVDLELKRVGTGHASGTVKLRRHGRHLTITVTVHGLRGDGATLWLLGRGGPRRLGHLLQTGFGEAQGVKFVTITPSLPLDELVITRETPGRRDQQVLRTRLPVSALR